MLRSLEVPDEPSLARALELELADQFPPGSRIIPQAGQWEQAAAAIVEAAIPADGEPPGAWRECPLLLPHARTVLDLTSNGIWQTARALGYSGSYAAPRDLFALIVGAHRDSGVFGPEHPDTLAVRANLAYWTGQAREAG
jgi:hypothetical protein